MLLPLEPMPPRPVLMPLLLVPTLLPPVLMLPRMPLPVQLAKPLLLLLAKASNRVSLG